MKCSYPKKNRPNLCMTVEVRRHLPAARAEAKRENQNLDGYIGHADGFFYFQETGNPELVRVEMTAEAKADIALSISP